MGDPKPQRQFSKRMERRLAKRQARAKQLQAEEMWLYGLVKVVVRPIFYFLFRPVVEGQDHLPAQGPYVLAANHKSFFDSFFQGLVVDQPVRWMAKAELFRYPGLDRLLVELGAFPVRRGQGDDGAIAASRALLDNAEILAVFPEGTRMREGLGQPKRGAARVAVEAGCLTVPMAISGTERGKLRRAIWHQGERVRMSIGQPVAPPAETGPEAASELTDRVWPEIVKRSSRLEGHRREALAAGSLAIVGLLLARRHRRRR